MIWYIGKEARGKKLGFSSQLCYLTLDNLLHFPVPSFALPPSIPCIWSADHLAQGLSPCMFVQDLYNRSPLHHISAVSKQKGVPTYITCLLLHACFKLRHMPVKMFQGA